MHWLDWVVVATYLVWIVGDGLRRTEGSDKVEGYFLANRSLPWWAVGLSVMATQMSADHARRHDRAGAMRRAALHPVLFRPADRDGDPVGDARAVLLPRQRVHRVRVSRAAVRRARRGRWRACCSCAARGLSLRRHIAAPAVILSIILGWKLHADGPGDLRADDRSTRCSAACRPWRGPTSSRCASSSAAWSRRWSCSIFGLPHDVGFGQALHLAGATGRLQARRLPLRSAARPTRSGRA